MTTEKLNLDSTQKKSLWHQRDFLLLWSGQSVSTIGTGISIIAFPFLVLSLTSSAFQAGIIGAIRIVPYVILSLVAGVFVDRWNRKRIMQVCDAGRALALGSIPFALFMRHLTLTQLYIVALTEGTLFVFFNIAATSAIPHIVPEELIASAYARNQVSEGTSDIIGPTLGTLLYSLNMSIPFLVDAISYTISVISLSAIEQRFDTHQELGKINLLKDISIGLKWLWAHQLIRYLAFLSAFLNLVFSGSLLAVIVLAMRLHASISITGIILSIGSTGTLLGAFISPSLQKRFQTGHLIITVAFLLGVCWIVQSVVPNPFFLAPIGIVMLSCMTIYNVILGTYLIKQIPDELRGRVISIFRLIAFGTRPIGLLIIGGLLNSIGPVITMFVAGCCICSGCFLALNNRVIRDA